MRWLRFGMVVSVLGVAQHAAAQLPVVSPAPPATEPAPAPVAPAVGEEPAPSTSDAPPDVAPPPAKTPPPVDSAPAPTPSAAPAEVATPPVTAPRLEADAPTEAAPPWIRAHSPLTLEGKLGFLVRPESSGGFDDESHLGSVVGLSLYMDLSRQFAAGLEIDRATLGRGTATSGLSTVSTDFSVTSAMLGVRAYPKRTELFDFFVGLQVGVGVQGVTAAGTQSQGAVLAPAPYHCGASDAPALQIGGGVGARFMLSPRWGITGRVDGTGRRMSHDLVEDCTQGIGTATTVSASIGLGYDFDLEP